MLVGWVAAAVLLAVTAAAANPTTLEAVLVYTIGLMAMLSLSAAYHFHHGSERGELLRRLDHDRGIGRRGRQTGLSPPVRVDLDFRLSGAGLGRGSVHAAAAGRAGSADPDPYRPGRRRLLGRGRDSGLASPAVPRCDLARAGIDRGGLSLRGDPARCRADRAAIVNRRFAAGAAGLSAG